MGEGIVWRRNQRRQHDATRQLVPAFSFRYAGLEPRPHIAALGIKGLNVGDVEKRTILRRKPMLSSDLLDQRQSVAQAARENKLGVLATLDPTLDEVNQAEDIVFYAVFFE